jgi:sulfur carrier protein
MRWDGGWDLYAAGTWFLVAGTDDAHTCSMTDASAARGPTFTVNGQTRPLQAAMTVAGLLTELGLDGRKVAVEHNEAIVPRSAYAVTKLAPGDSLEIVHFIGGG